MNLVKSSYAKYVLVLAFVLLGFWAIRAFNLSLPITVTTSQTSTELSVVGEGKVDVTPDTAYVELGISVEKAPTADDAQKRISERNNQLIAAIKALGIKEEDIKTTNFSVFPSYDWTDGRNTPNGYNGNINISVKTTDISLASKIVDTATKEGANQILGTRFVVDSPEKYRAEARDKAIANAREQAKKIADSLGIRLGSVTNVVESSPGVISPMPMYAYEKAALSVPAAGGAADLSAGTQTITSVVTLYFDKR